MSNPDFDGESHHRTPLECSKEFSGKHNCIAPCLAILSSHHDPALGKDVAPTNISSASTSRPGKAISSMDVTRRNKNGRLESHYRSWGGKVSFAGNGGSKMEKGKEPVIYEANDSRSSSNREEDGRRENFECIRSRAVVSTTAKRARIYESESEKFVGDRSLKRLKSGNSSFMNWVTSITGGLTRCEDGSMGASQHPSPYMKGSMFPSSISGEEGEYIGASHGTMGFRSIFQAVYHHGNNVSSKKIKYIDDQKEMELHKSLNFDHLGSLPDSSFSFDDGETENISAGPVNSGAHGTASAANDIVLRDEISASSKRFNKDVCRVKNSVDSCGELMAQSRNIFKNSLWITSLSHGVSSPHLESMDCSNCLNLSSSSQNKLSFLEAEKNRLNENPQHGSVRIVTENYESKLQLIISSEHCRRSKSISSSFAQRLDALKHTKSSNKIQISFSNKIQSFSNKKSEGKKDHHRVLHGSSVFQKENQKDAINADKIKMTSSCSSQNESKRSESKSFSSHLPSSVMDEPKEIFVAVRKLRLSRMDVLRWMKSRAPLHNIGGFFLRLRIGKQEKGLGAAGYYVGCINGTSGRSSFCVCVGSSTHWIASPFISNQDFKEEELMAWWFRSLRDGTKMPSIEELNEKLQLRLKFGF